MTTLLLLSSIALAERPAPVVRSLPAGMPQLELYSGAGGVTVIVDPDAEESTVTATPLTWREGCEVAFSGDSSRAVAEVVRDGERAGIGCRTRFEVTLAGPTALVVDSRLGRLRFEDLVAPVDAQVGLGSVKLSFAETPTGAVAARARVGRVKATFPYGAWMEMDLEPRLGWSRSEIPALPSAQTELLAGTGLGSVRVKTRLDTWENAPAPAVAEAE